VNEIIRKRKSIRKFDLTPLDSAALAKVQAKIDSVRPLYPDIRYSIEITNKTKGMFNIKAPHYLIFRGEKKDGVYENIGFIGQQMDLFLSESGIGACWLGASKPQEQNSATPFIICMAFGKPAEPLYRSISEFKRKSLPEISEGADERVEAARLAPSAINAQNWFFSVEDGKIHCFRKKVNPALGLIYDKLHSIDMGIALCHIMMESASFDFIIEDGVSERKGYVYTGTVV